MICLIFYCTNFITIFFYQLQYLKTCYQYISSIVIFSSDQRIYNINVRKEFCISIEGVPLLSISAVTNATQWDLVWSISP